MIIEKAKVTNFDMGGRLLFSELPTTINASEKYIVCGRSTNDKFALCINPLSVEIVSEKRKESGYIYRLESSLDARGYLSWKLFTRDLFNTRHEDLNANLFYQASMYFYMVTMGLNVERIVAQWNSGTNFLAYRKAIKEGKSVEQAVFSTWSGRKALEYGYNKVLTVGKTGLDTDSYTFYLAK